MLALAAADFCDFDQKSYFSSASRPYMAIRHTAASNTEGLSGQPAVA